jgi:hypothetical protein
MASGMYLLSTTPWTPDLTPVERSSRTSIRPQAG